MNFTIFFCFFPSNENIYLFYFILYIFVFVYILILIAYLHLLCIVSFVICLFPYNVIGLFPIIVISKVSYFYICSYFSLKILYIHVSVFQIFSYSEKSQLQIGSSGSKNLVSINKYIYISVTFFFFLISICISN